MADLPPGFVLETPQIAGMLQSGNINLHNRPIVKNADGSISTVRSMSFGTDQGEVLVPTVSDDGRIMSEQEAMDQFRKTGRNLGVFDTPEHATAYAESLHNDQANEYLPKAKAAPLPPGFQLEGQQPAQQEPGMLEQLGRQLGLTGRYAVEGVGNLLGTVSDPIGQTADALIPREKTLSGIITGQNDAPRYEQTGHAASRLADWLGLPKPQGALEEGVGAASRALVGTGLTAGAGTAVSIPSLADQAGLQAASAMLGGGATEGARQGGLGEGAQMAAGIGASLLPGAGAGVAGATRALVRGGEAGRQNILDNLAAFEAAGTTPTIGQATQSPAMRNIETMLSRSPGGNAPMVAKAKGQADEIGGKLQELANGLAPKTDPTIAGRAIERGITGAGGFVERFKSKARDLYDQVDQFMPAETPVPMKATQTFLAKMASPTKGAEATSALLSNPKLAAIGEALTTDVQNGALPYQAVKQLRTRVGEMVANAGLVSDVPRGELKQLYGALSQDIRAQTMQDPKAFAAANRAENFYRAGMDRLDKVESVVQRAGGPEKIFQAAMSGSREGASTLHSVMQSLGTDESKMVTSAVIRRLGRANPSAQNDVGDAFSTETFLSNWNGMSPQAKQVLFNRMGPSFRNDMDQIAKVASNLRDGSQVFKNPAGTAAALGNQATGASIVLPLVMGHPGIAAGAAGVVGATNMAGRAFTNPNFVKWLAKQTRVPAGMLPAQISVLAQAGKANDDPDLIEAAQLLQQGTQQ